MKLNNYKSISQQNGGSIIIYFTYASRIIITIFNIWKRIIVKKIIFFEKLNNKNLYPISNFKINEILKNDKNYIGTFSKNNVPILKNNESTIVNLADSYDKGTHWICYEIYK